jgi:hypothetical protein
MEAAAQNGIPTAFVVKDQKVQWIGHPMSMDEPLAKIVDGSWDAAKYKAEFDAESALARKQMERRSAMAKARKAGDWDAIVKMMDEDIAAAPERAKSSMMVSKFQLLLTDANKPADGYALGREIMAANKDNAMVLNQMAWFVVDSARVKDRDVVFAMEAAKAAVTASKGEDAAIMDTMARACWESGDKAKAVEWQKKAVEKADAEMAADLKETLKKYEGGEAPAPTKKTSFLVQDPAAPKAPAAPAAPVAPAAPTAPAASPAGPMDTPRAPRAPRPAAKLTANAEKVFPAVTPEGFESTDAIVAFLPTAGKDANGMQRMVRAMRSQTDGGQISLRVASALIEDMNPVVTASIQKFGKAGSMPIPVPANGAKFEVKADGESAATIVAMDAEGKPTGQPTPLVKVDGKWFFDFDKASGMRGDEGAQMAMMANMMGDAMRLAIKNAAGSTAKDILADKFKTGEEANAAFARAMQQEMMATMGGGMGPGAAPSAPAAPKGANAPAGAAPAGEAAPSGGAKGTK